MIEVHLFKDQYSGEGTTNDMVNHMDGINPAELTDYI